MDRIQVNKLQVTPIGVALKAVGKPYKLEDVTEDLFYKVGKVYKHESVMEHINISLEIVGISRLCLQELVRHRIASYTVESSRFTLKKLLKDTKVIDPKDYCVIPMLERGIRVVNIIYNVLSGNLRNIQLMLLEGIPNDDVKYILPESFRTGLVTTINLRSLINFLELRDDNKAHYEIQHLAKLIKEKLKDEKIYKFLTKK